MDAPAADVPEAVAVVEVTVAVAAVDLAPALVVDADVPATASAGMVAPRPKCSKMAN